MRIKYLGTAAAEAWPGIFCHCKNCEEARLLGGRNIRTRPQVLIDEGLLLDLGPDTYLHSLYHDVDMAKINSLLLTHSHTDHFCPSELILREPPYAYEPKVAQLMVYGNEKCDRILQQMCEMEGVSPSFKEYVKFNVIQSYETFQISNYEITSLKATHVDSEDCMIYSIKEKNGSQILYGNDTGLWSDATWDAIQNMHFDLVSLDCTMGILEGCYGHMSYGDNKIIKEKMLHMGCADENTIFVSTHFSHTCGMEYSAFQEMADKDNIRIAYDGMEIQV